MKKEIYKDYVIWEMTPQEEKEIAKVLDEYRTCRFYSAYPGYLLKKKLFTGYDLIGIKIWWNWVNKWYTEMVEHRHGQTLDFFLKRIMKKGLLNQDEYEALSYYTTYHNSGKQFPLPKMVEARMLIIKALLELSIERSDIEYGFWQNPWVLSLKLKVATLDVAQKEEDIPPWVVDKLRSFKVLE